MRHIACEVRFAVRALLALLICAALTHCASAAAPTQISLVGDLITLENLNVTSGPNQPFAGTGDMVFHIPQVDQVSVIVHGVKFKDLLVDSNNALNGVTASFDSDVDSQLVGMKLHVPANTTFTYVKPVAPDTIGHLEIANPDAKSHAVFTLPFNSQSGPVALNVSKFSAATVAGNSTLTCDVALAADVVYPGIKLSASPFHVDFSRPASGAATWTVNSVRTRANDPTSDAITLHLGVPSLPTKDDFPLTAVVHAFKIDQTGAISFNDGSLTANAKIEPEEVPGIGLQVSTGQVSMANSVPQFQNVSATLTLPKFGSDPAVQIPNVTVMIGDGVLVQIGGLDVKSGQFTLHSGPCTLDLSTSATYKGFGVANHGSGATDPNVPAWEGVYMPSCSGTMAIGAGDALKFKATNAVFDSAGPTGHFELDKTAMGAGDTNVDGFKIKSIGATMDLKRGQLVDGDIKGEFDVTGAGDNPVPLSTEFKFDMKGKLALHLSGKPHLDIPALGVTINDFDAQIDNDHLVASGKMAFTNSHFPDGLKAIQISVSKLVIAKNGKFNLPDELVLDLPDPKRFEVGPVNVELRKIGFNASGGKITGIIFSGGGGLSGDLSDVLPLSGELELGNMQIHQDKTGPFPTFELGSVGIDAEIFKIGKVSGSLHDLGSDADLKKKWGDGLAGNVSFSLSCFGPNPLGGNFDFLVAPKAPKPTGPGTESCFFVGGAVDIVPPVGVYIPVPPPSAPVPIFNVNGAGGGFGWNVQLASTGGSITKPETDLKPGAGPLLQLGVVLSDPMPPGPLPGSGHVWWADTALTVTLEPLEFNLASRAVFGDIDADIPKTGMTVDEWKKKDRIASAYIDLNLSKLAMTLGGDFDLTFPTRSASVINVSGAGSLVVDPDGAELQVGTKAKPLTVEFLKVAEAVADIKATGYLDMKYTSKTALATLDLGIDADAKMNLLGASVDAGIDGALHAQLGKDHPFAANGTLAIKGTADFGFFVAQAEADCEAAFNAKDSQGKPHPNELYLAGSLAASVNGVTVASAPIDLHFSA